MKTAASPQDTIDVDRLRIGMFIELDGGWMSHPFALSRFRIATDEQIATIRALGVRQVRWHPAQGGSSRDPAQGLERRRRVGSADVAADDASANAAALPVPPSFSPPEPSPAPSDTVLPTATRDASAPAPVTTDPTSGAQLAAQRAALDLCGRQFDEAAADFGRLTDILLQQPQAAREQAETLTRALATKMLGAQELCIRLLTDTAGERASRHALNVTVLSMLMGRRLGMPEPDLLDLGAGALLHDIGKLELPPFARHRDAQAPTAMSKRYEDHVALGVALAQRMGLSPGASLVVAQHHELADGSGFPLRLNADRMTLGARIVALVNRYDNLCNPHLPGTALTPHEALSLLFAHDKRRFETALLSAFIRMMSVYPAGSTVQLTDDRYAVVVGVNSSRPLKPQVLVHDAGVPVGEALFLSLDRVPGLGIRRCLRPQQLPDAARHYLSPRAEVAYFFEPLAEVPRAD